MAKRRRLGPARLTDGPAPEVKSDARPSLRAPIADVAQDASSAAALAEVAAELSDARAEGRLIQRLPLEAIEADHLIRDRAVIEEEAQEALLASLRDRGQQTPIEVTGLGGGRYGLISGYRRLKALETLGTETVLALVRPPADAADSYRAMVEENEIRANLSFYERARIVARATDAGVYRTDKLALSALFAAVPRARRSKIGSFVDLVRDLDDVLRFPTRISEKLGLDLVQRLRVDSAGLSAIRRALEEADPKTPEEELRVLEAQRTSWNVKADARDERRRKREEAEAGRARAGQAAPRTTPLPCGIEMTVHPGRRVVLSGRRLDDPDFLKRLEQTLNSLD